MSPVGVTAREFVLADPSLRYTLHVAQTLTVITAHTAGGSVAGSPDRVRASWQGA